MPHISSIAEFKQYITIDANTKLASLTPYRDEAEQLYMVELLGQAFYDELAAAYATAGNSVAALNANNKAIFPYIQRALSYYTLVLAMPHLNVTIGELGTRNTRSEHSDTAPRWQQEKLLISYLKSADTHADKLLTFLEANATVSVYGNWFASNTANTKMTGLIVYNIDIANQYIDINNSRRVFKKLLPKIKEIESKLIVKQVGQAQYDEIVTQLKTGSLTANNKKLTTLIEPIVSKRALYMALPFMAAQIDGGGVWLYSDVDDVRKKDFLADKSTIEEMREQLEGCDADAIGFRNDETILNQYVLDNITTYPLIKASGVYTSKPDPGPTWTPADPEPDDRYFSV